MIEVSRYLTLLRQNEYHTNLLSYLLSVLVSFLAML